MNKVQFIFGIAVTALFNLILLLTGVNEEIITSGFIFATLILFALSVFIKIMIENAIKETQATDWKAIGSFALGSGFVTIITIGLYLLAIE